MGEYLSSKYGWVLYDKTTRLPVNGGDKIITRPRGLIPTVAERFRDFIASLRTEPGGFNIKEMEKHPQEDGDFAV